MLADTLWDLTEDENLVVDVKVVFTAPIRTVRLSHYLPDATQLTVREARGVNMPWMSFAHRSERCC